MMRLNTPASSKPLMHTNWGNNREVAFAPGLMDGAWHHVAVVYRGPLYQYYLMSFHTEQLSRARL